MRLAILLALSLASPSAAAAPQRGAPSREAAAAQRESIELSLIDYERVPGKEALLALSPRAEEILRDIV